MMKIEHLTPAQGAELQVLYEAYAAATAKALAMIQTHGMDSREFAVADEEAAEVVRSIRKITGQTHWMA